MSYTVTLEHGSDGSCLAWVHELPGCFVRAAGREDALERLPDTIAEFLDWLRTFAAEAEESERTVVVAEEVESLVEADEDTEALLQPDRDPLTFADWARIEEWLDRSRHELLDLLSALPADHVERRRERRARTAREELVHIGFVELMYAAWTFDLRSRAGVADFLAWTRDVTLRRMRFLAEHDNGSVTSAEWAGAPRPEAWTARKAARRLIWHELLHLSELRRLD